MTRKLPLYLQEGSPLGDRILNRSLIYRLFSEFYQRRLTVSGRSLFWIFLLATAIGLVSLIIKIYFVWCLLAAILLTSIIAGRLSRVPLSVKADVPGRVICGIPFRVPLWIKNPGTGTALDLCFRPQRLSSMFSQADPEGLFIPALPGGLEETLHFEFEPLQRGSYFFHGFRQESLFPWGLWRDLVLHPVERTLLVYPRFHPVRSLDIPAGKRYQPGGVALSSNLGESAEFISTREFREGDRLRDIHWKSWARLGKPVVKEFQEEYFCRIALLLDTFLPPRSGEAFRDDFESALSLSASLAEFLFRGEYLIDLFAAGPEIYFFRGGRSLGHVENILDILACLEPCREAPFKKIRPTLMTHLSSVTTTVVVLLDWDETREETLRLIRDQGCAVKVYLVREKPPTREVPDDASIGPVVRLSPSMIMAGMEDL